mgnify:CR=1 FL=1
MPKPTPKPKPFDWADLDQAEDERLIPAGTGFTIAEYAVHRGVRKSAARERIRALVVAGKIRYIGKRRLRDSMGRFHESPVYGAVKP